MTTVRIEGAITAMGDRVAVQNTCGITYDSINVLSVSRPPGRSQSFMVDARNTLCPHYRTAVNGAGFRPECAGEL